MARALGSFLTVVLSFSCARLSPEAASEREEAPLQEAPLHESSGAAVIATLHTRDSELTITSSGGSVRYSLVDAQGVEKSMTLDELQSYDRNLYEFVKSATATATATARRDPALDARLGPSLRAGRAGAPAGALPASEAGDGERTLQRALTPAR